MRRFALSIVAAMLLSTASLGFAGTDEPASDAASLIFSRSISEDTLAGERGGRQDETAVQTQVINNISTNGHMENISVNNSVTGDNAVTGGSFANSHGFPMVIQNTGNGVLIQNSTILNVTIEK